MLQVSWVPRCLPVVRWAGREYFVDVRLREFRTRARPGEGIRFVAFSSPEGRRMLSAIAITTCQRCGSVVAGPREQARAACPTCGADTRPPPAREVVASGVFRGKRGPLHA